MRQIKYSVVAALAIVATLNASEDLGLIMVESTTIDDKFESKKNEVSSTEVITAEEIEKLNPKSIVDVLNTVPGLTATKVGTDTVKVHIRGVGNHLYMGEQPGVAVVIDGVPVQETTGKINVDLDNIASIKVIKGGASYLYGNDALGGAVIITTKRTKGESSSKIEAEGGSFGSKRILASTNQSFENSALQVQASYRDSDGYWDDAYLKHKSINGKYTYYIDDSSDIVFGLDYTTRETGDGNSITGITNAKEDPKSTRQVSYSAYYDTTLVKMFATYSKDFEDNSNFMFNVYRYTDDTKNFTARDRQTSTYHTEYKDEEWVQNGIKSEYRTSFDNFAVMAGIDIQRNSVDNLTYDVADWQIIGDLNDESNTDEDVNAVYTELKYQLTPELTATFNARYDYIEHDYVNNFDSSLNVNPSYDAFSYRAGLNYTLNATTNLYTSVSTGFKAPTASQISRNQEGVNEGLLTSGDLDIETTYNYEVGAIGAYSGFNYGVSIYQLDREDYIGLIGGSYARSSDDDEDLYYGNVGDMRSRGFELSLNSDKKKTLSFNMAYTYLDAVFTKYNLTQELTPKTYGPGGQDATYHTVDLSGNTVPRTSKHTLNLIVDYKPTDNLTISPELIAKSSYYADEVNKFKQPGYGVVNLRASYQIKPNIELFGKVDNLLDKTYYEFVNVSSASISKTMEDATIRVAPDRAAYLGIKMTF
jgi:iron complex outermembrane receptor protein